jgi:transposase
MIAYARYCQIQQLSAQGFSSAKIAELTGLNEKTVRKWRDKESYRPRTGARRASKLEPFKALIAQWIARADLSIAQIHQKLLEEGYQGARSILGDYVRLIRPRTHRACQSLHFEPGEAAQIDWGNYGSLKIGSTSRRLSFLCVVLCHSRVLYVEAFVQERIEHVLGGLANAFTYFGAVPRSLIVDNMKTAVIEHRPGCEPKYNARFEDFCRHFGAQPQACAPRAAYQKGRVETGVKYVKGNFFNGRDLSQLPADRPLESLNTQLRLWMENVANVREHKELRRRPIDLLPADRAAMLPLNANPCDTGRLTTVRVTNRCRVHCDGNRYSVPPAYSQKQIQLHCYHDRLCFYHQGKLIARHPRSYDRMQQIVDPDHQSALIEQQNRGKAAAHFAAFEALSPLAPLWLANLQHHYPNHLHHVRRILHLCELHGAGAVVEALAQTHDYGIYNWLAVCHVLERRQRLGQQPVAAPMAPSATSRELLDIRLPRPDLSHYPGNGPAQTDD